MTPFVVKKKLTQDSVPVACGRCPACFARRVSAWSFRLMQEDKVSISSHFITLTYDTNNVPITNRGYMSLDFRDTQLFFKRLRKSPCNSDRKIRYYLAGEYGGLTMRPHYHAIIYNSCLEAIQGAWGLGSVHYGTVEGASIGYCLKYMSKASRIPAHQNDDRIGEGSRVSKGIGLNYLSQSMVRWHLSDLNNRMYCNLEDGRKISMPRYYKQKIYTDVQKSQVAFHVGQEQAKKQAKAAQQGGENYEANKAKAIGAAFLKMAKNAKSHTNNKI